jgi:hypothetical protein
MTRVPTIYDIRQVAERSGRSEKAIRQLRARQQAGENVGPRFTKIDGRVYVLEDDLAAWLSGSSAEPAA